MFISKIVLSILSVLSSVKLSTSVFIDNGVIMLGVNDEGHLNFNTGLSSSQADIAVAGLAYFRDGKWYDSTSYGGLSEGWAASATKTSDSSSFGGGANRNYGTPNLSAIPATVSGTSGSSISNGESATTVAQVTTGPLKVTHAYVPSSDTNAYEITITLENTDGSETLTDIRYRRTMDWDIPPTTFSECVSIFWDVKPDNLESVTRSGFVYPDTFTSAGGQVTSPLFDFGPTDQGSDFVFLFKEADGTTNVSLGPGEALQFKGYYGAAGNKAAVDAIVASLDLAVVSYGYPNVGGLCDATIDGAPNTFFFGFGGFGSIQIISRSDTSTATKSSKSTKAPKSSAPTTSSSPTSSPSSSTNPTSIATTKSGKSIILV